MSYKLYLQDLSRFAMAVHLCEGIALVTKTMLERVLPSSNPSSTHTAHQALLLKPLPQVCGFDSSKRGTQRRRDGEGNGQGNGAGGGKIIFLVKAIKSSLSSIFRLALSFLNSPILCLRLSCRYEHCYSLPR